MYLFTHCKYIISLFVKIYNALFPGLLLSNTYLMTTTVMRDKCALCHLAGAMDAYANAEISILHGSLFCG